MTLKLLYEKDLPPSNCPEFRWHASARATKVQLRRLRVLPALISYPKGLAHEELLAILEKFPLYREIVDLPHHPVENPFPEVYATRKHTISLVQDGAVRSIESQLTANGVRIVVPKTMSLDSYRVQRFAYEYLVQILFIEANELLIPYVLSYAQRLGLAVKDVKITAPSLKWGSCSSDGRLLFSFFAMLLPNVHLRYLVLHELTHLTYLNHSDDFWKLLSQYLESDAILADQALESFSRNGLRLPVLF